MISFAEREMVRDHIFQELLFSDLAGTPDDMDESRRAVVKAGYRIAAMLNGSKMHLIADRLSSPRGQEMVFGVLRHMEKFNAEVDRDRVTRHYNSERNEGRYCVDPYASYRRGQKAKALRAIMALLDHTLAEGAAK